MFVFQGDIVTYQNLHFEISIRGKWYFEIDAKSNREI